MTERVLSAMATATLAGLVAAGAATVVGSVLGIMSQSMSIVPAGLTVGVVSGAVLAVGSIRTPWLLLAVDVFLGATVGTVTIHLSDADSTATLAGMAVLGATLGALHYILWRFTMWWASNRGSIHDVLLPRRWSIGLLVFVAAVSATAVALGPKPLNPGGLLVGLAVTTATLAVVLSAARTIGRQQ